jgi:hypothetical protein
MSLSCLVFVSKSIAVVSLTPSKVYNTQFTILNGKWIRIGYLPILGFAQNWHGQRVGVSTYSRSRLVLADSCSSIGGIFQNGMPDQGGSDSQWIASSRLWRQLDLGNRMSFTYSPFEYLTDSNRAVRAILTSVVVVNRARDTHGIVMWDLCQGCQNIERLVVGTPKD